MGNKNDATKWFQRCRLAWLERTAKAQGTLNRRDLMEAFEMSAAQVSGDLDAYQTLNPGALTYSLKLRTFQWTGKAFVITPAPWADFPA